MTASIRPLYLAISKSLLNLRKQLTADVSLWQLDATRPRTAWRDRHGARQRQAAVLVTISWYAGSQVQAAIAVLAVVCFCEVARV